MRLIPLLLLLAACSPESNRYVFADRCKQAGGVPVVPTDGGGVCLDKSAVIVLPK